MIGQMGYAPTINLASGIHELRMETTTVFSERSRERVPLLVRGGIAMPIIDPCMFVTNGVGSPAPAQQSSVLFSAVDSSLWRRVG